MANRKKISVQAFDYVQEAFGKYHNHQIYGCIKLNGEIKLKILEKAVRYTVNDLPQLASKYVRGKYKKVDESLKVELINSKSQQEEIEKIMSEQNNIKKGQQVRVVVIRKDQKDTILISMSHLLCDGMAFKKYMYLICKYYNDIVNGRPISFVYKGKNRDIDWIKKRGLIKKNKNRVKTSKECIVFSKGNINLFAKCYIDKKYYERIKTYIKRKNVTMNDLFLAVYYKAVWEEFNYPLKSICCAVDIRRYINDIESVGLCNQTGSAFVTIEKVENTSFEMLLQNIHNQMELEKEQGLCLKRVKDLETIFSMFPLSISRRIIKIFISNPKVAITNLGKIDKDKITFQDLETLDCRIISSLKKAPNFQVFACTFEEKIMFGVNMIVDDEGKRKINSFLNRYKKILEEIV